MKSVKLKIIGMSDFFMDGGKGKKLGSGMTHINTGIAISLSPSEDHILD